MTLDIKDAKGVKGWKSRKAGKGVVPWRKRERKKRAEQVGDLKVVPPAYQAPQPAFQPRKIENQAAAKAQFVVKPVSTARRLSLDAGGRVKVDLKDLMETAISAIKNTRMDYAQIRANGGPHPRTIVNWIEKRETIQPHLATLVAAIEACGYDFDFNIRLKEK